MKPGTSALSITGSQPIPSAGVIDFAMMAKGAGYPTTFTFDDLEDLRVRLPEVMVAPGPVFVHIHAEPASVVPEGGVIGGGASFSNDAETARAALRMPNPTPETH